MAAAQTWGERFARRDGGAAPADDDPRVLRRRWPALLAALGVYGLFSWSVALRTRELAIRLTLGAKPASVGSLVVRQSAMLVVIGLAVGIVVIQAARGTLSRVLYQVSPSDVGSIARRRGAAADRRARRLHPARAARDARRSRGGPARRVVFHNGVGSNPRFCDPAFARGSQKLLTLTSTAPPSAKAMTQRRRQLASCWIPMQNAVDDGIAA